MKTLRKTLFIVITLVLALTTGVQAYTGIGEVDPHMTITMPASLSDGKGNVAGAGSSFSYQFVEVTEDKYNKIKLLEARYDLMTIYEEWVANPDSEEITTKYNNACTEFESKYNEKVSDITAHYGITPELLTLIRNEWISELTDFDGSKWIVSTDSSIKVDLTTFKGTKFYIGWIKSGDVLDAETYKVTGTQTDEPKDEPKQDEPKQDEPKDEPKKDEPKQDEPKKEEPKQEEPKKEEPKQEEPKKEVKKDEPKTEPKKDPTASKSETLPHTGAEDVVVKLMAGSVILSVVFFRKYRSIK